MIVYELHITYDKDPIDELHITYDSLWITYNLW
jgi:hypothetical protein